MCGLLKWEWRKLFVKNHGFLLIIVFTAIMIAGHLIPASPSESPKTRILLSQYYEQYGGKLTAESESAILEKKALIDSALTQWEQLFRDYEKQLLTQKQLEDKLNQLTPLLNEKYAFHKFYAHYDYCSKDPTNRYLVDTTGWSSLLTLESPDFLLLIFSAFLTALVFKIDITKNLKLIVKPTYHGRSKLLYVKWFVAVSIAILLWIISLTLEILLLNDKFLLSYGNAPLQSVSTYANYPYNLTLLQGFLLGSSIQLFGLVYCCLMTICLVELLDNMILGLFLSISIMTIPYFAVYPNILYLKWPIPTGFIQGFYYLLYTKISGQVVSLADFLYAAVLSVGIMLLLCSLSRLHYVGLRSRKRLGIAVLLLGVLLSGCGQTTNPVTMNYSADYSVDIIEADDYYIYRDNGMMVCEKSTMKKYPLLLDPLEPEELIPTLTKVKTVGNVVYFMYSNQEYTKTIQSIDLDTGEQKLLYVDDNNQKFEIFDVVLWDSPPMTYAQMANQLTDFFILQGDLFLIRGESISLVKHGNESPIYEGFFKNVTCNGQALFFTDEEGLLCTINISSKSIMRYTGIRPTNVVAVDSKLFYLSAKEDNAVISLDPITKEELIVVSGSWSSFSVVDGYILLKDVDKNLYISSLDVLQPQKLGDDLPHYDNVVLLKSRKIILVSYDGSGDIKYTPISYS